MDILIERAGGVLTIALNRPDKKNAITAAMYQEMADAFFEAEKDAAVRAVLIRGNGGSFSAGNDLEDFLKAPASSPDAPVFQFLRRISSAQKPVVAAVAGAAVGVGTTMLLHCDLVYVSDEARLAMPFVGLGLVPEYASSLLVTQRVGHAKATELLLLGEPFNGEAAVEMGIANAVLPAAEVVNHARRRRIADDQHAQRHAPAARDAMARAGGLGQAQRVVAHAPALREQQRQQRELVRLRREAQRRRRRRRG